MLVAGVEPLRVFVHSEGVRWRAAAVGDDDDWSALPFDGLWTELANASAAAALWRSLEVAAAAAAVAALPPRPRRPGRPNAAAAAAAAAAADAATVVGRGAGVPALAADASDAAGRLGERCGRGCSLSSNRTRRCR